MASATDIITYIGIPLAVLGALPILYTFIRSILTLRSVRQTLASNAHTPTHTTTRASLISSIIEVELPRCTITPLDRHNEELYWKLNPHPSRLKGGSWTLFEWNKLVTGRRLYRLQYHDELREPQAEIEFEDLVAFLLDRGGVPDEKGWGLLRQSGLWTPAGTALLRSPRGEGVVLRVGVPDDSDGVLSLGVWWEMGWDGRGVGSLPPFWMRVGQVGKGGKADGEKKKLIEGGEEDDEGVDEGEYGLLKSIVEARTHLLGEKAESESARFTVEDGRVEEVYFEHRHIQTGMSQVMPSSQEPGSLWFVCAATALGQRRDTGLWNYSIPSQILTFARKDSMPCGVMVLLGIMAEIDTPTWATPDASGPGSDAMKLHRRFLAQQHKIAAERSMPPEQARIARLARESEERWTVHEELQKSMNARVQREEKRTQEALNSPRLTNRAVAEANLAYLVQQKEVPPQCTMEEAAEAVLYLMIVDQAQGKVIADVLEAWHGCSQSGVMSKGQLNFLMETKMAFCYASCLVYLMQDASSTDGRITTDMQECMKLWRKVRLG
jgi:hypothetical protein